MKTWLQLQNEYGRIAIAGAPKTGKSTLSQRQVDSRPVIGTDKYKMMPWAEIPEAMIQGVQGMPAFIIEGVQVARALRKGLEVDALVYLQKPMVEQLPGHMAMGKGIRTVLRDWAGQSQSPPPVYARVGSDDFLAMHPRAI